MKPVVVAFFAGILFAMGLCVSGMTNPAKIIAFLDLAGPWDPSLAFVMAGAVGVHAIAARLALRGSRPVWSDRYFLPTRREVDLPLIAGAAIFGLGWGTAGYCPGPAIVSLVAPSPGLVTFVLAMAVGTLVLPVYRGAVRGAARATQSSEPSVRVDQSSAYCGSSAIRIRSSTRGKSP
jgi:uncharacterized membrane protein YedE/YeeE